MCCVYRLTLSVWLAFERKRCVCKRADQTHLKYCTNAQTQYKRTNQTQTQHTSPNARSNATTHMFQTQHQTWFCCLFVPWCESLFSSLCQWQMHILTMRLPSKKHLNHQTQTQQTQTQTQTQSKRAQGDAKHLQWATPSVQ